MLGTGVKVQVGVPSRAGPPSSIKPQLLQPRPQDERDQQIPGPRKLPVLTLCLSMHWVTMTMTWTFFSHTMRQKSYTVKFSGPWQAMYSRGTEYPCRHIPDY